MGHVCAHRENLRGLRSGTTTRQSSVSGAGGLAASCREDCQYRLENRMQGHPHTRLVMSPRHSMLRSSVLGANNPAHALRLHSTSAAPSRWLSFLGDWHGDGPNVVAEASGRFPPGRACTLAPRDVDTYTHVPGSGAASASGKLETRLGKPNLRFGGNH